jgi:hypothetical protein
MICVRYVASFEVQHAMVSIVLVELGVRVHCHSVATSLLVTSIRCCTTLVPTSAGNTSTKWCVLQWFPAGHCLH